MERSRTSQIKKSKAFKCLCPFLMELAADLLQPADSELNTDYRAYDDDDRRNYNRKHREQLTLYSVNGISHYLGNIKS